jgi:tetratricopeptide (TPR) repeat protein
MAQVPLVAPVVEDAHVLPSFRQFFPSVRQTLLGTPRRAATVALVLLVVMGIIAGILARDYDATRLRLARQEFLAGAFVADARPDDAAEHYRAALALDRDNPEIRRALAVSLFRLGRLDEAETHLIELLAIDPIDAEANLLRARIAMRRQALADAEMFYQRAIYGRWGERADAQRIAARFELFELLSHTGARIQARAELLRLQAELPEAPLLERQLAARFMALGDPAQAAEVLQRVVRQSPADARAWKDLADAHLAVGRFREARDAALRALAADPQDQATRERIDQINEALALDPTRPGLSPAARFKRSGELLTRVLQDVDTCLAALPANATRPDLTDLRGRARTALAAKPTARDADSIEALTDQRIAVIDELWRVRVTQCGAAEAPLAWVAGRVGR